MPKKEFTTKKRPKQEKRVNSTRKESQLNANPKQAFGFNNQ
jgi:hypothetical protein